MSERYSELQKKWVVSQNGRILGRVIDLELDVTRQKVLHLVAGQRRHWWLLFEAKEETVIPWHQIEIVGEDTILVRGELADSEKKE